MAALFLEWFIPEPALVLEWVLPDDSVYAIAQAAPESVAALVGPPGIGAAETLTRPAATALNALRAVYVNSAGSFALADPTTPQAAFACGVTIGAASIGADATAQIAGEMTDAAWSWSQGPVYIGAGSALTQTPVTSGALVQIGVSTAPTKIIINPQHLADLA